MSNIFNPPTSRTNTVQMVEPLDPAKKDKYSDDEKRIAYSRLLNFIDTVLPE